MESNTCLIASPPKDLDGDNRWLSIHKRFLQDGEIKDPESELINFCNLFSFPHI